MRITIDDVRNKMNKSFTGLYHESYKYSYPAFIKYFDKKEVIQEHDFIIGANFTYGWMPRILKLRIKDMDLILNLINSSRDKILQEEELEVLSFAINRSIIGASKLLHFINPQLYPIWDSNVCMSLYNNTDKVKIISEYVCFVKLCHIIIKEDAYQEIHDKIQELMGYEISKTRSFELIHFLDGKNKKERKRKKET